MKTTIIRPEEKAQRLLFPLLATSLDTGITVFFQSERAGMVLNSGKTKFHIGAYQDDWWSCLDRTHWRIEPKGTKLEIVVD